MKTAIKLFAIAVLLKIGIPLTYAQKLTAANAVGAWEHVDKQLRTTMICSDKFFSVALYQVDEKKFIGTYGGVYRIDGNKLIQLLEFNTLDTGLIGKEVVFGIAAWKKGKLTLTSNEKKIEWNKVDDGKPGALAGAWLITGRVIDNENKSITPGARKTMKILSGTHFQWIAYNSETKEFFGTGGGTYTTVNGKYTEGLLFFSRDNTRVGANLQFDYLLEEEKWRHRGLSSKGDPIDEVWTKREQLGL